MSVTARRQLAASSGPRFVIGAGPPAGASLMAVHFPEARRPEPIERPRYSVVVITFERPAHLRRCLGSLAVQTYEPHEVIVVDSSRDERSRAVASDQGGIVYERFPAGRRSMPAARNRGIERARGDVVAFLDDDCVASPEWLERLTSAYACLGAHGAGGKVIDPVSTLGPVRRFLTSGEPWAEVDAGDRDVADVDFLQGGNMSFRRDLLLSAAAFDPRYTGSNYREETDLCFRLRRTGCRLLYVPAAEVTHHRAPRGDGVERDILDTRREFYHSRNQTYFVLKNYGLALRPLAFYLGRQTLERTVSVTRTPDRRHLAWWLAHLAGKGAGLLAAARYWATRALGSEGRWTCA